MSNDHFQNKHKKILRPKYETKISVFVLPHFQLEHVLYKFGGAIFHPIHGHNIFKQCGGRSRCC